MIFFISAIKLLKIQFTLADIEDCTLVAKNVAKYSRSNPISYVK